MTRRLEDIKLLKRAIETLDALDESKRTQDPLEAFQNMLEQLREKKYPELTAKQRAWVLRVLDEPEYENLVSEGKVPRGREVPTPAVLQNRPLKPPGRR